MVLLADVCANQVLLGPLHLLGGLAEVVLLRGLVHHFVKLVRLTYEIIGEESS